MYILISNSWSDGEKVYRVDYTADKDGYKPVLTTRLIGAAETQHEQQQKPVAHPPASFPIQAVSQKPESVQFEPAAVPPVSNLPVVQAVPASTVSLAPAPVNKPPVHITDDAVRNILIKIKFDVQRFDLNFPLTTSGYY